MAGFNYQTEESYVATQTPDRLKSIDEIGIRTK